MPRDWRYGDAGDRIPVAVGDVWQAGPHTLACGDLQRGAAEELQRRYGPATVIYSDPPWDAGNAKGFRTKAKVPGTVDFMAFLATLAIAFGTAPTVWVEMGLRHEDLLAATLEQVGYRHQRRYPITYYRKFPCVLIEAGHEPLPDEVPGLRGADDTLTPALVLRAHAPGHLVFDPCTGLGTTALAAHAAGHRFLGMELHPRRLAVTLDLLHKQYNQPYEKIDTLTSMHTP